MRITEKDLKIQVDQINRITGSPKTSYTWGDNGKTVSNIGHYYIDAAYGGFKLVRMVNEGGGITEITSGFVPKRELYNQLNAFIAGLEAGRQ